MNARFQPTVLDLEIEALLLEVLRDPATRIAHPTRREASLAWLDPDPRVGLAAAGLTKAERKLLQHHREEAAWLLRQLAFEGLLEDPFVGSVICTDLPDGQSVERVGSDRILERVDEVLRSLEGEGWTEAAGAELAAETRPVLRGSSSPLELLLASLRLAPSAVTRIDLAWEVLRQGNTRLAMQVAERAEQESEDLSAWIPARSVQAVIYAGTGHLRHAQRIYSEDAEIMPSWPGETLSWFTSSLQLGDRRAALAAGAIIDEQWTRTNEGIASWVKAVVSQRKMGTWSASREATALIPDLLDDLGATARWVTHVF